MREIKFRGLTVNGDWVYGDLTHDAPNSTAYYKDGITARIHWMEGKTHCNMPVKDETVGQYIGLHDKNDRAIFEGDIVCITLAGFGIEKNLIVKWEDGKLTEPMFEDYHREVIGNIYENPELLTEKTNASK